MNSEEIHKEVKMAYEAKLLDALAVIAERDKTIAELRAAVQRLGEYGFECEAGPLTNCQEYINIIGGSDGR